MLNDAYIPGLLNNYLYPTMLTDRLNNDLKDAMRSKDKVRLRTIRSLRAALLEKEISERQGERGVLDNETAITVLQKQAKQRRDALEQYTSAGREDLAAIEREELAVIESYLPEQLSEDEIRKEVESVIARTGGSGMKDMGKVMGPAMGALRGKADGRKVQQIVKELLNQS
jgi:uncharacterized protein